MTKTPLKVNNLNIHNNTKVLKGNSNGIQIPGIYGNPEGTNLRINGVNKSFAEIFETEKEKIEATYPSNSLNDDFVNRQRQESKTFEEASIEVDDRFELHLKDDFITSVTDFNEVFGESIEQLLSEHNQLILKRNKISCSDPAFQELLLEYDKLVKTAESIVGYSFNEWSKEDPAIYKVTP